MSREQTAYLIASIGVASYHEAEYALAERGSWRTRFAPVALARLLPLAGARAGIVVTRAARERWFDALAAELAGAGVEAEAIEIPDGRDENEILEVFSRLEQAIPQNAAVVLDVTFALRHLPFVYLATLAYAAALRGVSVGGIYYGAFEIKSAEGRTPILDITALYGLLEWFHALRSLRETGSLEGVARITRSEVAALFRRGERDTALSRMRDAARHLAAALGAGLPIEIGFGARRLDRAIGELAEAAGAPAARRAMQSLRDELQRWRIDAQVAEKKALPLTPQELDRQLAVASWYAERDDHPKALAVLREWMLNVVMVARGDTGQWLDYGKGRKPVEELLNAAQYRAEKEVASPADRKLASLWRRLADRRNALMHAGMAPHEIEPNASDLRAIMEECRELLPRLRAELRPAAARRRLLVTPLGLSPGVLYSAVLNIRPDEVLVITSRQARERIGEALEHAGAADLPYQVTEMADPHQGFTEIDRILDQDARRRLAAAGEVAVNITGGTTAMQYVAERIADEARRLGTTVRRVALVDRRPYDEQRRDPYVAGELVDL